MQSLDKWLKRRRSPLAERFVDNQLNQVIAPVTAEHNITDRPLQHQQEAHVPESRPKRHNMYSDDEPPPPRHGKSHPKIHDTSSDDEPPLSRHGQIPAKTQMITPPSYIPTVPLSHTAPPLIPVSILPHSITNAVAVTPTQSTTVAQLYNHHHTEQCLKLPPPSCSQSNPIEISDLPILPFCSNDVLQPLPVLQTLPACHLHQHRFPSTDGDPELNLWNAVPRRSCQYLDLEAQHVPGDISSGSSYSDCRFGC
jgi:hypothetical protein